jgi:hypothetical protein
MFVIRSTAQEVWGQRVGMTFALCKQIVQGIARFSAMFRTDECMGKVVEVWREEISEVPLTSTAFSLMPSQCNPASAWSRIL